MNVMPIDKKKSFKSRIKITINKISTFAPNHILYVVNVKNITNCKINLINLRVKYSGNVTPLSKNIWFNTNNMLKLSAEISLKSYGEINFYFSASKNDFSQIVVNNKFTSTNPAMRNNL